MSKIFELKERVYKANMYLWNHGLIKLTWGNVSEYDKELGIVAIKPSGVAYESLKIEDIVLVDIDGNPLEDGLNPSSDLLTHLEIYKEFTEINSVAHTHSKYAVMWSQSQRSIPIYGTTHADTFFGSVPCTRNLTDLEVIDHYELNTGKVIVETFKKEERSPLDCPAILVYGHGPFTFGINSQMSVENSLVLEEIAEMALGTELLNHSIKPIEKYLQDKHYYRKHGNAAYYGQELNENR